MKSWIVLLSGLVLMSGCSDMIQGQQGAMMGTLIGTAAGALLGKKEDRGKNALIGAGVGLLGGSLYGKNKECNQLRTQNTVMQRELETYEMRRELERLKQENEALRNGRTDSRKSGAAGVRLGELL